MGGGDDHESGQGNCFVQCVVGEDPVHTGLGKPNPDDVVRERAERRSKTVHHSEPLQDLDSDCDVCHVCEYGSMDDPYVLNKKRFSGFIGGGRIMGEKWTGICSGRFSCVCRVVGLGFVRDESKKFSINSFLLVSHLVSSSPNDPPG